MLPLSLQSLKTKAILQPAKVAAMCKVPHAETRPLPLFATIVLLLKGIFICRVEWWRKKDIEIQPGFKPGSSEFQSDALTNELLELWHRRRAGSLLGSGISELGNSRSYSVCAVYG